MTDEVVVPARRHRVRTAITESGFTARCSCGWSTVRRSRELRDQDADAHAMFAAAEPPQPPEAA